MGCDIHLFVEKKVNGKWDAVKGPNPDIEDYRRYAKNNRERGNETEALRYEKRADDIETGEFLKTAEDEWEKDNYGPTVYKGWAYEGRNYDLFAILADVRNGYGFAGSYTGEGFKPISDPKGLPEDISEEIKKRSDDYGSNGHSHSWFTVKELTEYDWEQETVTLRPGMYPVLAPVEDLKKNTETAFYKDCVGSFYTKSIPALKELAGDDSESVRIVFWFDN